MRVLRVVSDLTGNRKGLRKNHTLTLKTLGCEIKCQFFHFLLREIEIWLQNQINRIISCIKQTFFVWIRRIWKNKNIKSTGQYHYFWFTPGFSGTSGYRSCLRLPSGHAPDILLSNAKDCLVLSQICGP